MTARTLIEAIVCSGAMLVGLTFDSAALPISPQLCGGARSIGEALWYHLTLFPFMHVTMALAIAVLALGRWGTGKGRTAVIAGLVNATLAFGGMHLGAGAVELLQLDHSWGPMWFSMIAGMLFAAMFHHALTHRRPLQPA